MGSNGWETFHKDPDHHSLVSSDGLKLRAKRQGDYLQVSLRLHDGSWAYQILDPVTGRHVCQAHGATRQEAWRASSVKLSEIGRRVPRP